MRLTNSARQEAGLFQNIQTVPLCWNGAESLLGVAAGSRGHLTASPAMVTGAVAVMPSTLPSAVRSIRPHLAPCPRPAKGSWHAATHGTQTEALARGRTGCELRPTMPVHKLRPWKQTGKVVDSTCTQTEALLRADYRCVKSTTF